MARSRASRFDGSSFRLAAGPNGLRPGPDGIRSEQLSGRKWACTSIRIARGLYTGAKLYSIRYSRLRAMHRMSERAAARVFSLILHLLPPGEGIRSLSVMERVGVIDNVDRGRVPPPDPSTPSASQRRRDDTRPSFSPLLIQEGVRGWLRTAVTRVPASAGTRSGLSVGRPARPVPQTGPSPSSA